jgi:alkanesulfonate monooxygenase SsuD/methylene tetrahydromethanopterin reductase-like flavin-dependent oxidoreductase (luciferase family)
MPDREHRYDRALEFVDVVQALWRSAETGTPVAHRGRFFDLDGRLSVPPSAQGAPVLVQAGGSPGGRVLAGRKAEAVFTADMRQEDAVRHYREFKELALQAGRDPADVAVLPGFALVLGSTQLEADERYDELESRAPGSYTADRLSGILGIDVGRLPLDEPLPDWLDEPPAGFDGSLSFRETTLGFAREHGHTLRELLRGYGGYGHPIIIGTPETVADTLEDWFRAGAGDGFNLMPDVFPEGLQHLVDEVLPILRRRGLFRHDYEDTTLRGRLRIATRETVAR